MTDRDKEEVRLELALSHHKRSLDAAVFTNHMADGRDIEAARICLREATTCDHIRHALSFLRASKMAGVREEIR